MQNIIAVKLIWYLPTQTHKCTHTLSYLQPCNPPHIFFPLLPQFEMDPKTKEFLDTLTPQAQKMVKAIGSCSIKVSDVLYPEDRAVFTAIQEGLDKANEHATSQAQVVCIAVL